jgi:hypothetical protein
VKVLYLLAPIFVVSTKCIDPWVLESVVSTKCIDPWTLESVVCTKCIDPWVLESVVSKHYRQQLIGKLYLIGF